MVLEVYTPAKQDFFQKDVLYKAFNRGSEASQLAHLPGFTVNRELCIALEQVFARDSQETLNFLV
jgi:hypothetical protein